MEKDVPAVGKVFRTVVEARSVGQANLVPAVDGDPVDVVLPVASPRVDEKAPVRRPPMEIGGRLRGHALRHPALGRQNIYDRLVLVVGAVMTDAEPFSVEPEDVVVVVSLGE